MASTVSALSLSQFQPITTATIPLGCILAYNTDIPGCAINDFVEGSTCSESCLRGIRRVEYALRIVCESANAPRISLLGQALEGNLAEVLCPSTSPGTPIASSSRNPMPAPTSATPTTRRTSSERPLTFTTVRPSSTRLSASTATTESETKTEERESSTSTTNTSPTATPDTPRPTFIQSPDPSTSSSTPTSTSTSQTPEETSDGTPGDFSPFETFASSSTRLTTFWRTVMTIPLGLGLILLQ
ncbi:hypothetical protein P885DRAFT_65419 [Corynascus similis CBS 632.67]